MGAGSQRSGSAGDMAVAANVCERDFPTGVLLGMPIRAPGATGPCFFPLYICVACMQQAGRGPAGQHPPYDGVVFLAPDAGAACWCQLPGNGWGRAASPKRQRLRVFQDLQSGCQYMPLSRALFGKEVPKHWAPRSLAWMPVKDHSQGGEWRFV